jgi:hypothetical protein
MRIERFFGGSDERGMIRQAKIVIRTHVEHPLSVGDRNVGLLDS